MTRREQQLQRAACQLLEVYEARGLLAFCHVPNGGARSRTEAAILKGLGVKAGVPDLIVWRAEGRCFGIELKADMGSESDAQILWRSTLESLGHRVYVCWSLDEIELALRAEGVSPVGPMAGVGSPLDAIKTLAAIRKPSRAKVDVDPLTAPGKATA